MTEISQIDQQIDAIRRELRGLEKIDRLSAASWQAAWDKHPELQAREIELYRLRGIAQLERDQRAEKAYRLERQRAARAARLRKCPTCGSRTLRAA